LCVCVSLSLYLISPFETELLIIPKFQFQRSKLSLTGREDSGQAGQPTSQSQFETNKELTGSGARLKRKNKAEKNCLLVSFFFFIFFFSSSLLSLSFLFLPEKEMKAPFEPYWRAVGALAGRAARQHPLRWGDASKKRPGRCKRREKKGRKKRY
jgi:hypothetical protein